MSKEKTKLAAMSERRRKLKEKENKVEVRAAQNVKKK